MENTASTQVHRPCSGHSSLESENRMLRARVAKLEELVLRDTLTPLYNRIHFIDMLDRWIWRAHRYDNKGGLLFIDVDQLKIVNDSFGHQAGDQLLVTIAQTLLAGIRRSDIAARISGDEFGIMLENIDQNALPLKAKQIARMVSGTRIIYEGQEIIPSISVGFAAIRAKTTPAELLKQADRSMYEAKLKKSA